MNGIVIFEGDWLRPKQFTNFEKEVNELINKIDQNFHKTFGDVCDNFILAYVHYKKDAHKDSDSHLTVILQWQGKLDNNMMEEFKAIKNQSKKFIEGVNMEHIGLDVKFIK